MVLFDIPHIIRDIFYTRNSEAFAVMLSSAIGGEVYKVCFPPRDVPEHFVCFYEEKYIDINGIFTAAELLDYEYEEHRKEIDPITFNLINVSEKKKMFKGGEVARALMEDFYLEYEEDVAELSKFCIKLVLPYLKNKD